MEEADGFRKIEQAMESSLSFAALALRLGAALAIGLMIGLQREFAHRQEQNARAGLFAGARTFMLISLLGAVSGLAAELLQTAWIVLFALIATGALLTVAHLIGAQRGDIGLTTEMAALLTFFIGLLCYHNQLILAAAIGVVLTWLLALKPQTRLLAERISREDVFATLKFGLVTAVLLPLLPNQSYGPPPFDVLVPREVWLMVVFVSSLSFLGYVLDKLLGTSRSLGWIGFVGGLASTTALAISLSRRSHDKATPPSGIAAALLLGWAALLLRVTVIVAVLSPMLLRHLLWPLGMALTVGGFYSAWLYRQSTGQTEEATSTLKNPFELKPALLFGALYALVLVLTHTARLQLGASGLYISALIGSLAGLNAIAVSLARLSQSPELPLLVVAQALIIALAANLIWQTAMIWVFGTRPLRRLLIAGFLAYMLPALFFTWLQ